MDFTNADRNVLAKQLRKPEGEFGREVGKVMAQMNSEVTAFTLSCLKVQPGDHILEIGFGPGEGIAQAIKLTPNGFVAGIDYSSDMLAMAEERNHRAIMQEHVELTLGEAKKMPYEDESFDKIFAVNVFHFWADPSAELAECKRLLKPGGHVAFFMAYPSSWLPGIKETGVFIAREPADVEKALRDAGLTNVETKGFTLTERAGMKDYKGFAVTATK